MSDPVALFVLGLVVLGFGAELFSRGLVWLARAFGTGQPMDRLVVAAVSHSAPVLAVCLATGLSGYPRVALATVLGANIANVGLILGLAALVRPLAATAAPLRPGIVILLAASLVVWFLVRENHLSRPAGVILLAAFLVLIVALLRFARVEKPAGSVAAGAGVGWLGGVLLIAGIAGLLCGAALVARSLAGLVSEAGVGGITVAVVSIAPAITLRAAVAAVVAARRGEADAILGGVVGGTILNLLLGLGVAAVAFAVPVPDRLLLNEFPAMAVAAALLVPVLANGLRVHRWEGLLLLAAYAGFVAWELARV